MKNIRQLFCAGLLSAEFITSCATYNQSQPAHVLTGLKDDGNDQIEFLFDNNEKMIVTFQKSNVTTAHIAELQTKDGDKDNLMITDAGNHEIYDFKYDQKKCGDLFFKYGQNYSGNDGNPKIAAIVKYSGKSTFSMDFTK
jgi:hypothetical protein